MLVDPCPKCGRKLHSTSGRTLHMKKCCPDTKQTARTFKFIENDPKTQFKREPHYGSRLRVVRKQSGIPQIHYISSVELVQMDGLVLDGNICNPDKGVWFHMGCANHLGATFNIVTDGERFAPVDRYSPNRNKGKFKITVNTSPKASVDLKAMNQDDKAIINFAIKAFMEDEMK